MTTYTDHSARIIVKTLIGNLVQNMTHVFLGRKVSGLFLASGAVVLWASWPTLAVLAKPTPPFLIIGLAAMFGFLSSLLVAASLGRVKQFTHAKVGALLIVTIGLLGNNAFYLAAINRIGPAEANVVHYLWPVIFASLASIHQKTRITFFQVLGILSGFLGVAVALSPQLSESSDTTGLLLGACGAFTFATYSLLRSITGTGQSAVGPSMIVIAVVALVIHFFAEHRYIPDARQFAAIALIGIGPLTLSNVLWDMATRASSAATISSLAFLTPLAAIGLLSVFGLANITQSIMIGVVLAIGGAALVSRA